MSTVGSERLDLAARILALEAKAHGGAEPRLLAQNAIKRLHDIMFPLIGTAGFRALLVRAHHLAKREHGSVGSLVVAPASSPNLVPARADDGPSLTDDAVTALLAALLDLFCTFIGEELTLRQVHHVWTDE